VAYCAGGAIGKKSSAGEDFMKEATIRWMTTKMLGYSYYAAKGFRVLVPLVKTRTYDFVVEKYGDFIRVNVKIAGLKDKNDPDSWSINLSGDDHKGRKWRYETIDVFLAWLPEEERFVEVPGTIFNGTASKAKRIPKEFLV
jgi:hypothetical protein